ncbi:hypothetical protein EMIT0232MI5_140137 [Pseudomonas sp. IT-232MI5]
MRFGLREKRDVNRPIGTELAISFTISEKSGKRKPVPLVLIILKPEKQRLPVFIKTGASSAGLSRTCKRTYDRTVFVEASIVSAVRQLLRQMKTDLAVYKGLSHEKDFSIRAQACDAQSLASRSKRVGIPLITECCVNGQCSVRRCHDRVLVWVSVPVSILWS